MAKKKKRPTAPDWPTILITGAIDLIVGSLLLLLERLLD